MNADEARTVLWQHEQWSEVGLAPGQWCPQCGEDVPCPDERRARAALLMHKHLVGADGEDQ